jgi:hypothetical protein
MEGSVMSGKFKKGEKLICAPCGREIVVSSAGISRKTIWCCGRPMAKRNKAKVKKAAAGKKKVKAKKKVKKTSGKKKK